MNDFQFSRGAPLLKITNLSVSYSVPILRDVNIEVLDIMRPGLTQGQKVALLAPSGMGKTTIFDRISGIYPPTSGEILIGIEQVPVKAGMVGVVPQDYRLFNHRTVESSLMLAASMRSPNKADAQARVADLLEDFNLGDKRTFYPCQLSGGQRQRVSIAEQLLCSNHFLLMDEPFSGLDILNKKKVCDVINRVSERDELNTIIFSTHDIESAVAVADTIIILGHHRDAAGAPIPGATKIREIDLIDRNLAWHTDVERQPNFQPTVNEIKALFPFL